MICEHFTSHLIWQRVAFEFEAEYRISSDHDISDQNIFDYVICKHARDVNIS